MTKQVFVAPLVERTGVGTDIAFHALLRVAHACGHSNYALIHLPYSRTDVARSNAVKSFRQATTQQDDTLVMLDGDHDHPPDIVHRLVAADVPVVACLAFRRSEPYDPQAYVRTEDGELYQVSEWTPTRERVTFAGMAAIAIKRSVFDKLEVAGYHPPFFRYPYNADGSTPSEDVYFCRLCEAAGIPVEIDFGLISPHLTTAQIDDTSWRQFLKDHPELIKKEHSLDDKVSQVPTSTDKPTISVVIPSRGRADQLKKCINGLKATTQGHDVQTVIVLDEDDAASINAIGATPVTPIVLSGEPKNAVEKWNLGAHAASGDWLVLGADDLEWGDGWLEKALTTPNQGFIGFNDGHMDGKELATHYMMTREYSRAHNGGVLAIPHYHSWYLDVEATERAKRAGKFAFAREAYVEHRHPLWNKAQMDDTYRRGQQWYAIDQQTYAERSRAGFPDDFESVLTEATE